MGDEKDRKGKRKPCNQVRVVLRELLPEVLGALHRLSQQEQLHYDCHSWMGLLQGGQRGVLVATAQCLARCGSECARRLLTLLGQPCRNGWLCHACLWVLQGAWIGHTGDLERRYCCRLWRLGLRHWQALYGC